ncbi:MAG: type I secretion system permease/ATPase, partial [Pseudomonadota bacterium]
QAVALARTLLAGRQMLILDEPTAAMDNAMEARIVRELKPIIADRTLVVATHRASVLDLVDRVIWMDDGKILADGPKADVLARLTGKAAA